MFKNVNILEFGDDIQIHHEKCIEISANMTSIGLEIPEIQPLTFLNFFKKKVETVFALK